MKQFSMLLCLLLLTLCSNLAFAQWVPTANLTIFSDDGNKFFLILNGQRYNNVAQTNIRVEELPQPYYSCKVIFEDGSLGELSKNMLMLHDVDGIPQDVTYRIKKDKKNKFVLRFYSSVPAVQNMMRPDNCSVYRFGNPFNVVAGPGFIAAAGGVTTGMSTTGSVSVGGMNVQVAVNGSMPYGKTGEVVYVDDRNNGYERGHGHDRRGNGHAGTDNCRIPMTSSSFEAARGTLQNNKFEDNKLSLAKQIIADNCMTTTQIETICRLFSFDDSRLEFAKYAYAYCTDPQNYFKLNNVFSFESSKSALNDYVSGVR